MTATPLSPATYTEAINRVLRAQGKDGIALYPSTNQSLDEIAANEELKWSTREYQVKYDWKFNYEEKVPFTTQPSGAHAGCILLGQVGSFNMARVVKHYSNAPRPGSTSQPDVVERLDLVTVPATPVWKLYDLVNHTYNFGLNKTLYLNITYLREWLECVPAYQEFVVADAVVNVLAGRTGSEAKLKIAAGRRQEAWQVLFRDHAYRGGTKYTEGPKPYRTALDNYDVAKPVLVNAPRLGGMP